MLKQMRFQSKLVVTYTIFIAFLMLLLGFGFYYYNSYTYEGKAYSSLNDLAKKISQQLDNCVQTMDYLSLDVISNEDLRNALGDLENLARDDPKSTEAMNRSIQVIRNHTVRDSILKTVHRMSIFNLKGDYFTSNFDLYNDTGNMKQRILDLKWLEKAKNKKGAKYLLTPSTDIWAMNHPIEVFSLVRIIKDPGNEIGFVEVQNPTDILKQICSVGVDSNIKILVINNENNIVYSNKAIDDKALNYYISISASRAADMLTAKNPVTKTTEIISAASSNYTDWTVLIIQDKASLLAPLILTRNMTFYITFTLTMVTLIAFYFFSMQLTRPLRRLKDAMEGVDIKTLPRPLLIKHENNEIESLNKSFQHMQERLNEAIKHEIKSRSMQMRAHFEALQAQINPHFIYNMLNVLANMGYEAGVDEISETCRRIADMLRYSTSSENRKTTLKDELSHVENYLALMKKRFEHKLEYSIDVDERLFEINIPRIILQPLVENSIYHGFNQSPDIMKICVKGVFIDEDWRIDIIDNGSGFSEDILKDLEYKIESYAENICASEEAKGLSIGGMGIISTFARLSLYYGKELKFTLKNNDKVGACISIGGNINILV